MTITRLQGVNLNYVSSHGFWIYLSILVFFQGLIFVAGVLDYEARVDYDILAEAHDGVPNTRGVLRTMVPVSNTEKLVTGIYLQ